MNRPELTNGSDLCHKRTKAERRLFGGVGKHMNSAMPHFGVASHKNYHGNCTANHVGLGDCAETNERMIPVVP